MAAVLWWNGFRENRPAAVVDGVREKGGGGAAAVVNWNWLAPFSSGALGKIVNSKVVTAIRWEDFSCLLSGEIALDFHARPPRHLRAGAKRTLKASRFFSSPHISSPFFFVVIILPPPPSCGLALLDCRVVILVVESYCLPAARPGRSSAGLIQKGIDPESCHRSRSCDLEVTQSDWAEPSRSVLCECVFSWNSGTFPLFRPSRDSITGRRR